MAEFPFLITALSLIIYTTYAFYHASLLVFMHSFYTCAVVLYNALRFPNGEVMSRLMPPPSSSSQSQKQGTNICKICNRVKPLRFYHCRRCNICIFQMDHHCDWLNCCVGQFNYKIYLHLLLNLLVLGLNALFDVFVDTSLWLSSSKIPRLIFSGFMLWLTVRMLWASYQYISQNQTLIETYKKVKGPKKSISIKLTQIFGCKFNMTWFLPTYSTSKLCNIYEPVFPLTKTQAVEEHTYADEYLYGPDDEDQFKNQ